jgi:hypothetical protein
LAAGFRLTARHTDSHSLRLHWNPLLRRRFRKITRA